MKQKRLLTGLAVCGILSAAVPRQLSAAALSLNDVQHLVRALTVQGGMTEHDDFNGDGRVNAIDLALMKRALLSEQAETGEVRTLTVPASAESVKLIGRTVRQDGTVWLVQSGAAAECTVTASSASVTIAGDGNVRSDAKYRPRYGVYVDGELVKDVVMDEEEQTVELFSGSQQRTATVKVIHLSEANNGAVGVKSYTVTSSAAEPVRPTEKKRLTVEFIGDSITCAYGVEAESQYVGFETATENFTLSYAYRAAELLDADYSAVCYSGYGIISGYTGDGMANTDSLLPDYYEYVGRPEAYRTAWDFAAHPVDAIVVNLGTNDDSYAKDDLETRGAAFGEQYAAFLKQIRQKNPDAAIICTLGIMGCQELYPYIEAAVQSVGDPKITCYESQTHNIQQDGIGADWHPSPKTHELNSYIIADKICEALGIESKKIGIDLAADGEYGAEIDKDSGANGWPYFSDWDKSLNVNMSAPGSRPEDVTAYVRGLNLPAGEYELSFRATPSAGCAIPYAVRSMADPDTVYCSGRMNADGSEETVLKAFSMPEAAENCEIVFLLGEMNGQITFRNVTLYKRG
ncbi:MAG: hypothetical protein II723_06505 [Oscillospiraceae bacterium]|nr:hypothetical protein [Oscillospiraceae bacterium]